MGCIASKKTETTNIELNEAPKETADQIGLTKRQRFVDFRHKFQIYSTTQGSLHLKKKCNKCYTLGATPLILGFMPEFDKYWKVNNYFEGYIY